MTPGIGNYEIAGMNPLWWFGSADAGYGGSLTRDTTPQQASIYIPRLRRSVQRKMAKRNQRIAMLKAAEEAARRGSHEGFSRFPCAAGGSAVVGEDGGIWCLSDSELPGPKPKPQPASRERMHNPPCTLQEVVSTDPNGDAICLSQSEAWDKGEACAAGWEPSAVAETQGLYAAGAIERGSQGERRLRQAANATYDTEMGLNEAQITQLAQYDQLEGGL